MTERTAPDRRRRCSGSTSARSATPSSSRRRCSPLQPRQLHWRSTGLPYAVLDGGGPTDRSGELSSSDGVFLDDVGPLAGPVSLDVPSGGTQVFGLGSQGLPFPQPPAPDVPPSFASTTGGGGLTDATSFTGTMYATFDNQMLPSVTAVRCYGGGTLRLSFGARVLGGARALGAARVLGGARALGAAACDGQTHTFTSRPARRSDVLQFAGDRVQSYRFMSGTVLLHR